MIMMKKLEKMMVFFLFFPKYCLDHLLTAFDRPRRVIYYTFRSKWVCFRLIQRTHSVLHGGYTSGEIGEGFCVVAFLLRFVEVCWGLLRFWWENKKNLGPFFFCSFFVLCDYFWVGNVVKTDKNTILWVNVMEYVRLQVKQDDLYSYRRKKGCIKNRA